MKLKVMALSSSSWVLMLCCRCGDHFCSLGRVNDVVDDVVGIIGVLLEVCAVGFAVSFSHCFCVMGECDVVSSVGAVGELGMLGAVGMVGAMGPVGVVTLSITVYVVSLNILFRWSNAW